MSVDDNVNNAGGLFVTEWNSRINTEQPSGRRVVNETNVDQDGIDTGYGRVGQPGHATQPEPAAQAIGEDPVGARAARDDAPGIDQQRHREHVQVQDGAVQAVRGVRRLQIRRQVSVCARYERAAKPGPPSEIQNGIVPHVSHGRFLPLRAAVSLRSQSGRSAG